MIQRTCVALTVLLGVAASLPLPPDAYRNATEMIREKGYPCEDHVAITSDGYILSMQRIPHARGTNGTVGQKAVFLQPGLTCASDIFVCDYLNCLPYELADAGYDVWIVNSRDVPVPRHVTLQPSDPRMWEWSFDQLAQLDVAAGAAKILEVTGLPVITAYIGHSQGGLMGWAAFSSYPDLAAKFKLFVSLAGPAGPPPKTSAPAQPREGDILCPKCPHDWPGCCGGLFGLKDGWKWDAELCVFAPLECTASICLAGGCESDRNYNMSRVPVFVAHYPSLTSRQNMNHWTQLGKEGFRRYDYGSAAANMQHYNQTTPPIYNVSNLAVKVALFSGQHDHLVPVAGINKFLPYVPQHLIVHNEVLPYGHLDFVFAADATTLLYSKIIQLVNSVS